jgi:eco47II restriction endonuclease
MRDYQLGFISSDAIFEHVQNTVRQYRKTIDLKAFNHNIIDPIKLTFDAKIYGQSIRQTIESECIRQIDKTNNNKIGYFHQHIFKYAGGQWQVPNNGEHGGFDVVNDALGIYAEVKNKHNTMNSASASATYLKMLDKIMRSGNQARCYLVEAIAKQSQDMMWEPTIVQNGHKEKYSWPSIRKISMDRFYGVVFGDNHAFFKLCKALPLILDDVITADHTATLHNSVYDELDKTNFYRSLYLLAFQTYEGFEHF